MAQDPLATAENAKTLPRLPLAVFMLGFASFFTDVASDMIFPLLPAFVTTLGGSAVYLGLIEGVADAVSSMLKLASGYVADRVPRRKPLVLFGYGLAALARPLVAFASAPVHVLIVRVTDRVGKGIRSSPRDALIASLVPSSSAGRAFGVQRGLDHAGAVVGPIIASVLLAYGLPLRDVFLAASVPSLLGLICVIAVREPARAPIAKVEQRTSEAKSLHAEPLSPPLKKYLWILALFALGGSSDAFLLLRARELGVEVSLIPLLWSACHVSKVVSSYVGGGLADRVRRAPLIASGWLVYGLTYVGLGLASGPLAAWVLFIVYGTYAGLTEPAERALIRDLAPKHAQGRAFGYFNFVLGVSAVPAGLLTGLLWTEYGALTALSTGAVLACAAAVALLIWDRAQRAARND